MSMTSAVQNWRNEDDGRHKRSLMLRADAPVFVPSASIESIAERSSQVVTTSRNDSTVDNNNKTIQPSQQRRSKQRRRQQPIQYSKRETTSQSKPQRIQHASETAGETAIDLKRQFITPSTLKHNNNDTRSTTRKGRSNRRKNRIVKVDAPADDDQHHATETDSFEASFPVLPISEKVETITTTIMASMESLRHQPLHQASCSSTVGTRGLLISTTEWSTVAAVKCDKDKPQEQRTTSLSALPADVLTSDFGQLTLLKPSVRKHTKEDPSKETHESCNNGVDHDSTIRNASNQCSSITKSCVNENPSSNVVRRSCSTNSFAHLSRRTNGAINMDKLRERWWDLIQQKISRDSAMEAEKIQSESSMLNEQLVEKAVVVADESVSIDETEALIDCYDQQLLSNVNDDENIPILEEYSKMQFPFHVAIMNDDEAVLRALLSKWSDFDMDNFSAPRRQLKLPESDKARLSMKNFTPLHLAVYLDKPLLVSLLVQSGIGDFSIAIVDGDNMMTPFMLGSQLGRDACLSILLSHGALVATRDAHGNNALHYCCRSGGPVSTLKMLLSCRHTNGTGHLYKLLASRNDIKLQSPLHLACTHGHNHLVETLLNILPGSTTARLLALRNHLHQTPLLAAIEAGHSNIVLSLLMWSGNHTFGGNVGVFANNFTGVNTVVNKCPLVAAVQSENVSMVQILLEFHDPSSIVFNLTEALHVALKLQSEDCKLEMIQILVEAGANAFREVTTDSAAESSVTAVTVALRHGNVNSLATLVDAAMRQLELKRCIRRQDPRLQKQPESFFSSIQAKEDSEMDLAMSGALVRSLFAAWENGNLASRAMSSCLLLFRRNARLDMSWLRQCFVAKSFVPRHEVSRAVGRMVYAASYRRDFEAIAENVTIKSNRNLLSYWSRVLCAMPWMDNDTRTQCNWFKMFKATKPAGCDENFGLSDCILLVTAEKSYLVHEAVVAQKSAKLAAAIRFATMNEAEEKYPITVHIAISSKMCQWMLQHMYHGSLINGWAIDDTQRCCQDLLELMLVAEEFICPSLMQECEMRLLSCEPTQCFCWNCCKAVRKVETLVAECLYFVHGPPRLIVVETAVDCLGISQQLSTLTVDYLIKFWREAFNGDAPKNFTGSDCAWKDYQNNEHQVTNVMTLAGDASAACLLKNFSNVLQQKTTLEERLELSNQQTPSATLLAVSLDELACSPLRNAMQLMQSKRVLWTK